MQEVVWPFLELKVYTAIDKWGKLCVLKLLKIKWNKAGMFSPCQHSLQFLQPAHLNTVLKTGKTTGYIFLQLEYVLETFLYVSSLSSFPSIFLILSQWNGAEAMKLNWKSCLWSCFPCFYTRLCSFILSLTFSFIL